MIDQAMNCIARVVAAQRGLAGAGAKSLSKLLSSLEPFAGRLDCEQAIGVLKAAILAQAVRSLGEPEEMLRARETLSEPTAAAADALRHRAAAGSTKEGRGKRDRRTDVRLWRSESRKPGDGLGLFGDVRVAAQPGQKYPVLGHPSTHKYLYTVDEAGLHIGLEVDTHRDARYPKYLKHTNLSMRAAIGGEVWFHADGKTVTIDADSGRFGLESNAARHSGSLTHAQWDATVQLWQSLGYTIVSTQEVFSELPDPAWKPKARPHETKSWKSQPRLIEPRESKATGKAPTRSSTRARLPIEPKIPGSGLVERRSTARLLNVRLLVESLRRAGLGTASASS